MGFHFTVQIGQDEHTWKSTYANVETLCQLASQNELKTGLAQSASRMHSDDCEVLTTAGTLRDEIQKIIDHLKNNKHVFSSFAYRRKNVEDGKYGAAKTEPIWVSNVKDGPNGREIHEMHTAYFGTRECLIRKNEISDGRFVAMEKITDLRNLDEFTLPDGSTIQIVRKPGRDTLTPELNDLVTFLDKYPTDAEVTIMSG